MPIWRSNRSVSAKEMSVVIRQLACLLSAGVPITRCFDILQKSEQTTRLRTALAAIKQHLLAGHTLYHSLCLAPDCFDTFTRELIHLGEKSGKLDLTLASLADFHEKKFRLHQNIKQALFYPCIIFITATMLTLSLFLFVIPSFEELFHDSQSSLPLLTRLIFAVSMLLHQHIPLILLLVAALLATLLYAYQQGRLATLLIRALMKLPRLHASFVTLSLIRFSRSLGMALSAGVPILTALHLTANLCGHTTIASGIRKLRVALSTGMTLHHAMSSSTLFPHLIQQMVKIGEETGTLDRVLIKAADLLEAELEAEIAILIQLLEPLIMALQGALIGGLVIGMYLPVFNLGSAL